MKNRSLFASVLVSLSLCAPALAAEFYVDAATGNDAWGGTSDAPVKSLARATELVNASTDTSITVHVGPGNYGEDSGTDVEATYTGKNDCTRACRFALNYKAGDTRQVLVVATQGKALTHIVGKKDATTQGCGPNAVGGVVASDPKKCAFVGFTIRNGYSHAVLDKDNTERGGGATSVMLVDCVVSNCVAQRGGGVQSGRLVRCRLTGNSSVIGYGDAANSTSMAHCLIDHHAGTSVVSYQGTMVNCTIVDNDNSSSVFNAISGQNTVYNTLVLANTKNGTAGCNPTATAALAFTNLVTAGSSGNYPSTADATTCRFGVTDAPFNSPATGDYRLKSDCTFLGAGDPACLSVLTVPAWVGDTTVRDFAGRVIDAEQETIQVGCFQEVVILPPAVIIEASAEDVEVEGGVIGRNVIGADPIVVRAKRAATRPFLGFAVDGTIVTRETSYDLRLLGLQAGEVATLTAVYGTVWYVAQNGGNDANGGAYPDAAKLTLKAALTNAISGDVVKVYPGVYGESDGTMMQTKKIDSKTTEFHVASRAVVPSGVALESVEGAEKTFIVGRADPDAAAEAPDYGMGSNAVRCVLLYSGASVSGFTITGGRADKYNKVSYDDNSISGGILGDDCLTCTVRDCIVSNNVADEGGFGMDCTFVRSRIVDNIGVTRHASRNCRFCGCYINGNRGGAMEHVFLLDSCTIGPSSRNTANTKDVAFLQYPGKSGKFVNSILLAKISELPGADYCYSVTNCVLLASEESKLQNEPYYAPAYSNCTFIANAAAAGLDGDFRPVPGQTIAGILDAVTPAFEAMTLAETLSTNDVAGVPRVLNGARDVGAFEGDWRPRYSTDIGGRAQVTEASPAVIEANGKVAIPGGSKVVFAIDNKATGAREYALAVTVTGGTLSVKLDGEAVSFTAAADIRLTVPTGVHSVTVELDGESADLATIQSLRNNSGFVLFVR